MPLRRAAADAQRQGRPQRPCRRRRAVARRARPTWPPRTPTEEALAAIWAEVLARRARRRPRRLLRPGRPLAARHAGDRRGCRDAFGVELPLRGLFEAPTVAGLAAAVDAARPGAGHAEPRPPLVAGRPRRAAAAARSRRSASGSSTSSSRRRRRTTFPRSSRCAGALDVGGAAPGARARSCAGTRRCARRFADARRPARAGDRPPAGPRAAGASISTRLPEAERRGARRSELAARGGCAPVRPRARARCCAPRLLRLGADEHVLLLTLHHIVADGWSLGRARARAGRALSRRAVAGEPRPLPELPVQYADYAVWQRELARGRACSSAQLAYWRERLAGAAAACWSCPPTGRARRRQTTRGGGRSGVGCRPGWRLSCSALGRQRGRDALHDAAGRLPAPLLAPLSRPGRRARRHPDRQPHPARDRGADRLLRQHAGAAHRPVGRPERSASCSGACARRRWSAYAHQDVPFEKLVEELQPERDLSRTPLFQVMFAS